MKIIRYVQSFGPFAIEETRAGFQATLDLSNSERLVVAVARTLEECIRNTREYARVHSIDLTERE